MIWSDWFTGHVPPLMADKDKLSVPAARSIGPILSIVSEVLLLVNVLSELRGLVQETLSGFPVIIPDRLT